MTSCIGFVRRSPGLCRRQSYT